MTMYTLSACRVSSSRGSPPGSWASPPGGHSFLVGSLLIFLCCCPVQCPRRLLISTLLILRKCHSLLHGDPHSYSSSESVTRCFALRLLLCGGVLLAGSPSHSGFPSEAAHHTPSHRLRLAELLSYTRRTSPPAILKACSPESTQLPIAVRGLGIPITTVSQQPISIRMVELSRHVGISTSPADCLASLL